MARSRWLAIVAVCAMPIISGSWAYSDENTPFAAGVWNVCWNGSYFDFTADAWTSLSHRQQFEYAGKYQAWYAKKIGKAVAQDVSGITMQLVPPGRFERTWMDAKQKVLLTQAFWLGKTEVTQAQWQRVMGNNPSHWKGNDLPVEQVSWDDCQSFCGKTGMQLPTEAQWEYACRSGVMALYCFGDSSAELRNYAWYNRNSARQTHSVGQKNGNAWGCHDMHGNVFEWCADWYGDYQSGEVSNPDGSPTGSERIYRGSSWYDVEIFCFKAGSRGHRLPFGRNDAVGFRVVLSNIE